VSDMMLDAVLRMPPDAWSGDPLDTLQRHARYVQAADELAALRAERDELRLQVESLQNKWASRPIDHPNGEALASENDALRARVAELEAALLDLYENEKLDDDDPRLARARQRAHTVLSAGGGQ